MSEQWEERLAQAAAHITLSEADRARILKQCAWRRRKVCQKRRLMRMAAVLCLLCLSVCYLSAGKRAEGGTAIVYAAADTGKWTKLEPGQRQKLLKMEPEKAGIQDKAVEAACVFQLELPERYLFEQEGVIMGPDFIRIQEGKIYWWVYAEQETSVHRCSMRLRIVDHAGNLVEMLELILFREGEDCYAQLQKLW